MIWTPKSAPPSIPADVIHAFNAWAHNYLDITPAAVTTAPSSLSPTIRVTPCA